MSYNENWTGPIVIDYWANLPMCLRCNENPAQSDADSVLQLCDDCIDDVCPGCDVDQYTELMDLYAYC